LLAGLLAFAFAAGVLAGLFAFAVFAGAVFDALAFAGAALVAGVVTGEATVTGVLAGLLALALFAGALLAAPPQAMPSALNPRTDESIIFFILFKTPNLTQLIFTYPFPGTGRS
jgi:hypothetical protein